MEGTGYRDSRNASSSDDRFWDNDRTSERTPLRPGRDDRQALPSQKHHPQQYPPPYSAVLAEDAQLTSLPSQQSRAPRTNLIGWLVWIAAFVGATITAICIPRPGSHDVLLVAGSRKLVELPTKWFREVEIAGSSHVDTYLFDEEPPLTDVIQLSKKIDIDINRGSYHFVRYDLHPDSNVEVKWSFQKFDHIPTFGVIKGESRFAEWVAGNDVPLFYDRTAASGTFTLRILKTSAYYFMFFAQQSWDNASGWATLNVNATTYTLEGSIDSCPIGEQLSCSLDLAAGKHAYLLLVPPMDGDSYNLTYRTLGRSEVYTNLWLSVGAVALFCGVLTALLSWVPLKGVLRKCRGYEPIAADAEPPADGSLASPRSENVPLENVNTTEGTSSSRGSTPTGRNTQPSASLRSVWHMLMLELHSTLVTLVGWVPRDSWIHKKLLTFAQHTAGGGAGGGDHRKVRRRRSDMLTSTTAGGSLGRYSSLRSSSNGSSTSVYAGGSLSSATGRTPLPRRSRRLKEKQLAQNGFAPGEGGGATSTSASSSSDGDLTESATSETDGGSPRPLGRLRSIPSFTSDGEYSSSSSLSHIPRHISSPRRHRQPVKKTLILDLDETLIHSTSRGSKYHHHMVEVLVDRHVCLYYVYKRPHCDLFLRKVSEWYKVVIFTASMAEYADPVVDWLDPQRKIFAARYFRQSCLLRHGFYIKNLAVVEPDLSRVCLVDNSPISYQLNEDNGIPTDTWVGDTQDEGLLDLLPFLDALRFVEDVRHVISMK